MKFGTYLSNVSAGAVHYIRRSFDEAAILAVASKVAWSGAPEFSDSEQATIAAMQRAHPQAGGTTEALGEWLRSLSSDQIDGVVSNTKGVLHEMEFVRIENSDGDSVQAALFDDTNHRSVDVYLFDTETGTRWEVQLKSTDDPFYVQSWIDAHPDGEILVTEEVSEAMGLQSSGLSNADLTARTEDVVDRLIVAREGDAVWDYFPALSVVSIAIVAGELINRHRIGEIDFNQLKWMLAKATGLKVSKIALLTLAMSIPGLNVVTGALLAAHLIHSAADGIGRMRGSLAAGA